LLKTWSVSVLRLAKRRWGAAISSGERSGCSTSSHARSIETSIDSSAREELCSDEEVSLEAATISPLMRRYCEQNAIRRRALAFVARAAPRRTRRRGHARCRALLSRSLYRRDERERGAAHGSAQLAGRARRGNSSSRTAPVAPVRCAGRTTLASGQRVSVRLISIKATGTFVSPASAAISISDRRPRSRPIGEVGACGCEVSELVSIWQHPATASAASRRRRHRGRCRRQQRRPRRRRHRGDGVGSSAGDVVGNSDGHGIEIGSRVTIWAGVEVVLGVEVVSGVEVVFDVVAVVVVVAGVGATASTSVPETATASRSAAATASASEAASAIEAQESPSDCALPASLQPRVVSAGDIARPVSSPHRYSVGRRCPLAAYAQPAVAGVAGLSLRSPRAASVRAATPPRTHVDRSSPLTAFQTAARHSYR
jgi:hypothetical protein